MDKGCVNPPQLEEVDDVHVCIFFLNTIRCLALNTCLLDLLCSKSSRILPTFLSTHTRMVSVIYDLVGCESSSCSIERVTASLSK
jgi:hypothetical protein